jgi:hypothetical protein
VTVGILDPGDEQPVEPQVRRAHRPGAQVLQPPVSGRDVVAPEDDRRPLTRDHRVEAVVVAGGVLGGQPDPVVVQHEVDVDRRALLARRRPEDLREAGTGPERDRALEVAAEQDHLGRPERRAAHAGARTRSW